MRTLSIREEVWRDLEEAYVWYAERSPISAERFRRGVDRCLQQIADLPEQMGRYGASKTLRRCPVRRFPYVVIFEYAEAQTTVYTIRHTKRRRYHRPRT